MDKPDDEIKAELRALEAAEQEVPPGQVRIAQITVTLGSTGRSVQIAVPGDLTPMELIELVGWMTDGHLANVLYPPSPIVDALGKPIPAART